MMRIFFDTEFTELGIDPRLISIGLVAEDGERTFYAELSDTYEPSDCGDFAREAVLPLLEGGDARMTFRELAERLAAWLAVFDGPVKLACDSLAWDWPWIQELFGELDTWPANVDGKPLLLTMNYLNHYDPFVETVEQAFRTLRRHHSLDDAKANRLGWIAAGGDIDLEARDLLAAKRFTPPNEAEQNLWQEVMDDNTGEVFWLPRKLYDDYQRQQLERRGLMRND